MGALITSVKEGSPAAKAGLRRGDVIIELDGKKILDPGELPRMVAFGKIGKTITIKILRKSKTRELKAVIELRPEQRQQKS